MANKLSGSIRVSRTIIDDVKEISELEISCFSEPWSELLILQSLKNPSYVFFTAKSESDVLGYISMNTVFNEVYINNLAVSPSYRNMGIGTALLKKLLLYAQKNQLKFISLEVRKSNVTAILLYKKQGFEIIGERKNFYRLPQENAIIMTKLL